MVCAARLKRVHSLIASNAGPSEEGVVARNQVAIEGFVSTESSASARGENNQSKSRNEESAPLGRFAIRDRVRELRRVRAGDLVPNPKNWRRHPAAQVNALHGVMAEVGFADA